VRAKRGLSYGAYCRVGASRAATTLDTWVFPEQARAAETLALVTELLEKYAADGPDRAEVEFARRYRAGGYLLDTDSPGRRLARRMDARLLGLPESWVREYADHIRAVRPDAARRAAIYFDPKQVSVVVVCTAAAVQAELERHFGVAAEVVDFRSF
jgi:zinc protease